MAGKREPPLFPLINSLGKRNHPYVWHSSDKSLQEASLINYTMHCRFRRVTYLRNFLLIKIPIIEREERKENMRDIFFFNSILQIHLLCSFTVIFMMIQTSFLSSSRILSIGSTVTAYAFLNK